MEPYTDGSRAFFLRRDITAGFGTFYAGKYVRGLREGPKYPNHYTIWPPDQSNAFIVGVPRRHLRPAKSKAHT